MPKLFAARRPFDYTDDVSLDQGQVFEILGRRNDEVLIRLGYCEPLTGKPKTSDCRLCSGKFLDEPSLNRHGRKRHPREERTPHQEDALMDTEEKRLAETAPLYLDKTKASQKGSGRQKRA